jgi:hypothetical protein
VNRYRKISVMMWGDRRFKELSRPQPNAQTLWYYLITGPHCTSFPAAFSSGEAGLAEDLEWPMKAFRKVFGELLSKDMVHVDWPNRYIFIPKAFKHNPPENPNVVSAWKKAWTELPDCPLKVVTFDAAVLYLTENFKPTFVERFGEELPKGFREEFGKTEQNISDQILHRPPDPETLSQTFGEFGNVRLSPDEHAKLSEKLGSRLNHYIARLDRWGAEEPAKFRKKKSHYATILNWVDRDGGNVNQANGSYRPTKVVL